MYDTRTTPIRWTESRCWAAGMLWFVREVIELFSLTEVHASPARSDLGRLEGDGADAELIHRLLLASTP